MAELCIDLCCGRKGFSRAFKEAGWEVVTVDINPKFEPSLCADVIKLMDDKDFMALKPKVILTSPPCERFSRADDWPMPGIFQALSVAGACLEIVARLRPQYWGLENPNEGMLRWFIGAPTKRMRMNAFGYRTVKRTGIWGNLPLGLIPFDSPHDNQGLKWENGPRDPAVRAEITPAFSKFVLEAIEARPTGETKEGT